MSELDISRRFKDFLLDLPALCNECADSSEKKGIEDKLNRFKTQGAIEIQILVELRTMCKICNGCSRYVLDYVKRNYLSF